MCICLVCVVCMACCPIKFCAESFFLCLSRACSHKCCTVVVYATDPETIAVVGPSGVQIAYQRSA